MKNQTSDTEERTDLRITVCANGVVNVLNPDGDDHEAHSVMLADDGTAVHCSCKGYRFHGHCYHTNEVEGRPLIVATAKAARGSYQQVATDGGTTDEYVDLGEYVNEHHERPDGCTCWGFGDCVALAAPTRPCKTCTNAGFTEPAPDPEVSR